jgi:hypothetical protein
MQTFLAPVFALAVPRALLMPPWRRRRARRAGGAVTRKSSERRLSWFTSFQHIILALLLVSIGVSIARPGAASWAVVMWACVLAAALASPGSMLGLRRDVSQSLRIAVAAPAIGAAVLVALSLLPANAVNARDSTRALTQQAAAALPPGQGSPAQGAATRALEEAADPPKAGPALSTPAHGIYLGMFNRSVAGPPSHPVSLRRYRGVKFRILHRFQAWWGNDRFLGEKWLDAVAANGAVPMVSWEPWLKPKNAVAAPTQRRGILRQIASGRHDLYIRRWARDARAYGKPILLRFMHEMNGNWYPWSVNINGNTPAAFRAAWRHVHDIFTREGATNVGWVLSVESFAGGTPTSRKQLDHLFPGKNYVDWIGLSGFNWGRGGATRMLSYEHVFRRAYEVVKGYGKPIILAETGTASADRATAPNWVRDALRSTPTRFPRVKALVWYDSSHPARDFTLRGSALARLRIDGRRPLLRPPLRLRARG